MKAFQNIFLDFGNKQEFLAKTKKSALLILKNKNCTIWRMSYCADSHLSAQMCGIYLDFFFYNLSRVIVSVQDVLKCLWVSDHWLIYGQNLENRAVLSEAREETVKHCVNAVKARVKRGVCSRYTPVGPSVFYFSLIWSVLAHTVSE